MGSIATSLLQIDRISLQCGRKLGVDGKLFRYCRVTLKIEKYEMNIMHNFFFSVKYVGLQNLEVRFIKDLSKIWHLQLRDL